DRDEIADEEEGFDEREGQGPEEDSKEAVEHALLRVLGADLDRLLRILDGGLRDPLQLDVSLDELDRAIGAGGHRLRGGSREPVDSRAARNRAEGESGG